MSEMPGISEISKIYQVHILNQNYSEIKLSHENDKESLLLNLSDIANDCRNFYDGDLCTYNLNTKELKVIDSQIKHKKIVGEISINIKQILEKNNKGNPYYIFTPSNKKYPKCLVAINDKILEPKPLHQSRYYVVIRYDRWLVSKKLPYGELLKVLGQINNENVEYTKIIYEYELEKPKKYISKFNTSTKLEEMINSDQLKKLGYITYPIQQIIAIDPQNTMDVDDALSYCKYSRNSMEYHRVGIHITDVSFWVSYLNLFEYLNEKQFTTYMKKCQNFDIFPKIFSEHLFSLKEDKNRLAISLFIDFIECDGVYEIDNYYFEKTIIKLTKRLSYKKADKIINCEEISDISKSLFNLFEISKTILPECNLPQVTQTHDMVEKYMILCNKMVAEYLIFYQQKCILRVQNKSSKFNKILDKLRKLADNSEKLNKLKRFMQHYFSNPGEYTEYSKKMCNVENLATFEHYALNLKYYMHFTSPIRRTADIWNHFALKCVLNKLNNLNHCTEANNDYSYLYDINKINSANKENKIIHRKCQFIYHKYNTLKFDNTVYSSFLIKFDEHVLYLYFPAVNWLYKYKIAVHSKNVHVEEFQITIIDKKFEVFQEIQGIFNLICNEIYFTFVDE